MIIDDSSSFHITHRTLINLRITLPFTRSLIVLAGLLLILLNPLRSIDFPTHNPGNALDRTLGDKPLQDENPGSFPTAELISANHNLGAVGTYSSGSKVEIGLTGPDANSLNNLSTPFRLAVDVTFSDAEGSTVVVPAFYAGDGSGGAEGNVWKVRFRPYKPGEWQFVSTSLEPSLNGYQGSFTVSNSSDCPKFSPGGQPDFGCTGFLKYTGGHFLQFDSGEYWIKGGVDDPENFLGDAFGDWAGKKAAVDYLASKGVNSIYMITNNIDGDRSDTWPWIGNTPQEAKQNSDKFNVAKLQEWEDFFTYVQSKGIVLHIVLNDDGAWSEFDHELYYQEMIARFGHHPGLIWNIGEEANESYSNDEQIELAKMLQTLDPYDHPVTVHRKPLWPFLGNPNFDLTSIQPSDGAQDFSSTSLKDLNEVVNNHRDESVAACRPIPIMIDELPRVTQVNNQTQIKMRSEVLYPIYFGGGNFEMHYLDAFGQGGGVPIQQLEPLLLDMQRARQYLENLPVNQMSSCNNLVAGQNVSCFGKNGDVYVVYIPQGGQISIDLTNVGGSFTANWFNPRTGTTVGGSSVAGGMSQSFSAPDDQDWVLQLDNLQVGLNEISPWIGIKLVDNLLLNTLSFKVYLPGVLKQNLELDC